MAGNHDGLFQQTGSEVWPTCGGCWRWRQVLWNAVCVSLLHIILRALLIFSKKILLPSFWMVIYTLSCDVTVDYKPVRGRHHGQFWLPHSWLVDSWSSPSWRVCSTLVGIRPWSQVRPLHTPSHLSSLPLVQPLPWPGPPPWYYNAKITSFEIFKL